VSKRKSVTLIDNPYCEVIAHNGVAHENSKNIAYLEENSTEIIFTISVTNNYYLKSVSYTPSSIAYISNNNYELTLSEIEYSIRVTLYVEQISDEPSPDPEEVHNEITYDANGGEYILSNGRVTNKFIYSTAHHPRPNTSIGTNIMKRDGYTLLGWNTKQDGTGEHISLGSRYLDIENDCFTLYAEWIKYEATNYEYRINQDEQCAEITKYNGSEETVSIPEYIDGLAVKTIKSGAFTNCPAKKMILPKSVVTIEPSAFTNCSYTDLYFYDNLLNVGDDSFVNCNDFTTIHINAIEPPRSVTADRNAVFADKMDLLMLKKDTKKFLIYGGSGAFYSIDACYLSTVYEDYDVLNIAMDGFFNNFIQMDIISHFIGEGDVFLHSIESCGLYQFMTVNDMGNDDGVFGYDSRFYDCLELNYDLLSLADMKKVTRFFTVFEQYNNARMEKPAQKYEDYTPYMDERGDFPSDPVLRFKAPPYTVYDEQGQIIKEATVSEEGTINLETTSEEGLIALGRYYDDFAAKGASSYFEFACLNYDSLTKEEQDFAMISAYQNSVINGLNGHAQIINMQSDVLYEASWFADSDYHLDYEHSLYHTEKIAEWMGSL